MTGPFDYCKDPAEIYRQSFEIAAAEADLSNVAEAGKGIALRLIHACAMPDIVGDLACSDDFISAATDALQAGAPIICDCEMVKVGIIQTRLPQNNKLICTLNDKSVPALAQKLKTTRSAAAVELWKPHINGALVVIGNAPTALFHLLEGLQKGWPKPAAIIGFCVGFVGATESKQALLTGDHGVPFITIRGRRGGSAMACAIVNALGEQGPGT